MTISSFENLTSFCLLFSKMCECDVEPMPLDSNLYSAVSRYDFL